MTDSEVITVQREAILKYCKGDRKLALRIIYELGLELRELIEARRHARISADEIYQRIKISADSWVQAGKEVDEALKEGGGAEDGI